MSIEDVFHQHGIDFIDTGHHHCHDGWIQLHCPFCTDGRHGYHLGFNLGTRRFNCWRCGSLKTWDVLSTLFPRLDKRQLVRLQRAIGAKEGVVALRKQVSRDRAVKEPPGTAPLHDYHKRYLQNRKFDPDEIEKNWGVKGTQHLSGIWCWRIIVPIFNAAHHCEAYSGRSIKGGVKPTYRLTDGSPVSTLYGIDRAQDAVIIVEGIFDVWRLGPGAVATLGIDWHEEQANILRKFRRRFVLFDPGEEAQERARSLARWLAFFPGVTELVDDLECDPGDLSSEEAVLVMKTLIGKK